MTRDEIYKLRRENMKQRLNFGDIKSLAEKLLSTYPDISKSGLRDFANYLAQVFNHNLNRPFKAELARTIESVWPSLDEGDLDLTPKELLHRRYLDIKHYESMDVDPAASNKAIDGDSNPMDEVKKIIGEANNRLIKHRELTDDGLSVDISSKAMLIGQDEIASVFSCAAVLARMYEKSDNKAERLILANIYRRVRVGSDNDGSALEWLTEIVGVNDPHGSSSYVYSSRDNLFSSNQHQIRVIDNNYSVKWRGDGWYDRMLQPISPRLTARLNHPDVLLDGDPIEIDLSTCETFHHRKTKYIELLAGACVNAKNLTAEQGTVRVSKTQIPQDWLAIHCKHGILLVRKVSAEEIKAESSPG